MATKRFSEPQLAMLRAVMRDGSSRRPYGGGREAGRDARAWDRTAESLVAAGVLVWEGGRYRSRVVSWKEM